MKKTLLILVVAVFMSCSGSKKAAEDEKGKEGSNFRGPILHNRISRSVWSI